MNVYTRQAGPMLVEYKENLSQYDIDHFKHFAGFYEGALNAPMVNYQLVTPDIYAKYIDKTASNLNDMTGNIADLNDFFSSISVSVALDDRGITIPLVFDEEIEKIRPEYLKNVSVVFNKEIQDILTGKAKEGYIRKFYVAGEYFDKVKKQLVRTSIPDTMDLKDLIKLENPSIVKIDTPFIQNNLLPFIRSFDQSARELNILSSNVKGVMNYTYTEIKASLESIRTLQQNGKLSGPTLDKMNLFKYNFVRGYYSLCAYLSTMLIRKMSCYTYNMMSYVNLQNIIYNHFPDGANVLHENVMNGKLDDIDDTTLLNSMLTGGLDIALPHIQSVIGKKKMELANIMAKKYNYRLMYSQDMDMSEHPYDVYPYAIVNQSIKEISDKLSQFDRQLQADSLVDEVLDASGLSETFISRYEKVLSRIANTSFYTEKLNTEYNATGEVFLALYNDIIHYDRNVKVISENVRKCYQYIESLQRKYVVKDTAMDEATYQEIVSCIVQFTKSYKDYILQVTKRLLDRLDELTYVLDSVELPDAEEEEFHVESDLAYDYTDDIYYERYCDIEEDEKSLYTTVLKEYVQTREKRRRGVKLFYEEVAPSNAKTPGGDVAASTPDQTPKQAAANETNQNANQNNNNQNANQNNNQTNQNQQNTAQPQKKVPFSVSDFLNKIKDKVAEFLDKVKSITKTKVPKDVLNLENPTVTTAKYPGTSEQALISEINNVKSKITGISTTTKLPVDLRGNKNTAAYFLCPHIPSTLGNLEHFSERSIHVHIYGNTADTTLFTYTGEDGKNKVKEMVDYMDNYTKITKNVTDALEALSQAAMDKQTEIINAKNPNGEGEDNSVPNKMNETTVITTVVKDYYTSILTVMEKKYLDYKETIRKIRKSANLTDNTQNTENNEQNAEQNQNTENNNQNG